MADEKKTYRVWLILNYKTGVFRAVKKLNKTRINSYEIPIDVTVDVMIPTPTIVQAKGCIQLTQAQMSDMLIQSIEDSNHSDVQS